MKKLSTVFISFLMLVAMCLSVVAQAQTPKSGLKVLDPAGNWSEDLILGQDGTPGNIIRAWEDGWYTFEAVLDNVVPAVDPIWEWETTYVDGVLTLYNASDAPWYNKKVADDYPFVYEDLTIINLTYKDGAFLQFFLVGYFQGQAILSGSYAGNPAVDLSGLLPGGSGVAVASDMLDMATVKAVPLFRNKKK